MALFHDLIITIAGCILFVAGGLALTAIGRIPVLGNLLFALAMALVVWLFIGPLLIGG